MKTYTYSYQNVKKPGRLRTAPAGAGKLAGYPKGPECTYHGRGVLHTPPQPGRKARMGRTRSAQGFAPIVHTPGVSPLAMIRRPYRALPRTRPGCRPGGP